MDSDSHPATPRSAPPRALRRVAAAFLLLVALAAPIALAQTPDRAAAGHDVAVTVPSTIGIRIVGTGPARVTFDYAADLPGYLAAAEAGTPLEPTGVSGFDDIEVRAPGRVGTPAWYVTVTASPLAYSGTGTGVGLELGDLGVEPGASSGLAPEFPIWLLGLVAPNWSLSSTPQWIAYGYVGSGRWRSLGFNGADYRLRVQGDEDPGAWQSTVTYTMVMP